MINGLAWFNLPKCLLFLSLRFINFYLIMLSVRCKIQKITLYMTYQFVLWKIALTSDYYYQYRTFILYAFFNLCF